jgi:hypothetical protein
MYRDYDRSGARPIIRLSDGLGTKRIVSGKRASRAGRMLAGHVAGGLRLVRGPGDVLQGCARAV